MNARHLPPLFLTVITALTIFVGEMLGNASFKEGPVRLLADQTPIKILINDIDKSHSHERMQIINKKYIMLEQSEFYAFALEKQNYALDQIKPGLFWLFEQDDFSFDDQNKIFDAFFVNRHIRQSLTSIGDICEELGPEKCGMLIRNAYNHWSMNDYFGLVAYWWERCSGKKELNANMLNPSPASLSKVTLSTQIIDFLGDARCK
jgi:hypothetical protein